MLETKEKFSFLNFVRYKSLLDGWSAYALLGDTLQYNEKYPLQAIISFLTRNKTEVKIKDNVTYKRPTIKLYNQGIKLRDVEKGTNIGTKNQFLIKEGQFLLSKIDARNGAFGVVPQECEEAIITGNFWTFDVDYEKINPHYLALVTSSKQFHKYCQSASVGTTGRHYLQQELFLKIKIPLPNISEQQILVDSYNQAISEAKEAEEKSNQLTNDIETYLNNELGIEIKTNKVEKGLQFVRFKNVDKWGIDFILNTKEIVKGKFDTYKIGELCKIGSGGTPSRTNKAYYNGTIPWIKTGEVINGIIYDTEEKITEKAVKESSAKLYSAGSLIIAMYGQGLTRGRTAKLGIDATTNQACAVLYDINNDLVLTDYLWIYLQNEYHRIRELASGNNQPNLNAGMIFNYDIQVPPKDIQVQIIKSVSERRQQINTFKEQIETLKTKAKEQFENELFTT